MCVALSDVYCPDLARVVENAKIPAHKTEYGELVTYTCASNYQFTDASNVELPVYKTTRCNGEGVWEPLPECVGVLFEQ